MRPLSSLPELAVQLLDSEVVDWDALEAAAATAEERGVIRHLRIVAGIASLHRSISDAPASAPPPRAAAPVPSTSARSNLPDVAEAARASRSIIPPRWGHLLLRERIGAGASSVVYRAWDTRLQREVALKLLSSRDDDVKARALAEGRRLARVSHPNVIAVYGAERIDGRAGIWMELVTGHTVADLITQFGTFSASEAALLGQELCRSVSAIHLAGLVHRDIKAQNVMRAEGGRIILMDLGTGRCADDFDEEDGSELTGSPMYCAPEVLAGRPATPRSDQYSLGVLLFHVVTGTYPFGERSLAGLRAAHARGERAPLREIRPDLPEYFIQTVERALDPDPLQRYDSMGAMEAALARTLGSSESVPIVAPATTGTSWTQWAARVAIVVTILAGAAAWWTTRSERHPDRMPLVAELAIDPPPRAGAASFALSRDGRRFAYAAATRAGGLYERELGVAQARSVPGGATGFQPFFSPDGRWVAFFADGALRKTSLETGVVVTLAEAVEPRGGSWGDGGDIVYAPHLHDGLWKVPATGGRAMRLTTLADDEISHRWPEMLPGGHAVLFTIFRRPGRLEDARIAVLSLDTGVRRIIATGSQARYARTGHILYAGGSALMAMRFDLRSLEARPPAVQVRQGVLVEEKTGFAHFAVSDTGRLLTINGGVTNFVRELTWIDREGRRMGLAGTGRSYELPRLSPDGTRVMTTIRGSSADLWLYDVQRGSLSRFTSGMWDEYESPSWSPDGRWIAFTAGMVGRPRQILLQRMDPPGEPKVIVERPTHDHISGWTPDGGALIVSSYPSGTSRIGDILLLPIDGSAPRPLVQSRANERDGRVSPDGRWFAYVSDESGRDQVYVRPWPALDRQWQVSVHGGSEPVWSRSGDELFLRTDREMMAVSIAPGPTFSAGMPGALFADSLARSWRAETSYDVTPDGRFLMLDEHPFAEPRVSFATRWLETLSERVR